MEAYGSLFLLLGISLAFILDSSGSGSDDESTEANVAGESDSADGETGEETPLEVVPVTNFIALTDDDDEEEGTDANDQIQALAGDDVVFGSEGDDRIFLGDGDDISDDETAGDDLIRGGAGDDFIFDDEGSNTLYGDLGNDQLVGLDESNDPSEADSLFGGFGADTLLADESDIVSGGGGEDTFIIEFDFEGDPTTITDYEPGEEIVLAPPAIFDETEVTITPDEAGENMLIGVGGQTTLILEGITDPDDVNVSLGAQNGILFAEEESDLVIGTDDADTVDGGRASDIIYGRGGDDIIEGGSRTDFLYGGDGDDSISGGAANDALFGGLGDDSFAGGEGDDIIIDVDGANDIRAGSGADFVSATDSVTADDADQISLGEGDDFAVVDDGDTLRLGTGDDLAVVSVEDATDTAVTLLDFDPTEDILAIEFGDGTGVLGVAPSDDGTFSTVTVDDQEVAILNGIALTQPTSMFVLPVEFEAL